MPTTPEQLIDALRKRLIGLAVDEDKLLPALEDAFVLARDAAGSPDWATLELPDIARTIIVRGARRIIVNPDEYTSEQSGDHLVQTGSSQVFSKSELTSLGRLGTKRRVGSVPMSRDGLAETWDEDFWLTGDIR